MNSQIVIAPTARVPEQAAVGRQAQNVPELDRERMSVVAVTTPAALSRHIPEWESLAASAIEPNVFYEHWILLPAMEAFGAPGGIVCALVFAPRANRPTEQPVLCGLFPLVHERSYKGLPTSVLRLWQDVYTPLCTPLLRAGYAREALDAFFAWANAGGGQADLLDLRYIAGDGLFHHLVVDYLHRSEMPCFISDQHTRAVFRPASSFDEYLRRALNRKRRKDYRQQAGHLAAAGRVEYTELKPGADLREWIETFLRLEASGWKGREGSAIASRATDREFFERAAAAAFERGRLRMLSLNLDGRPIAQKYDYQAGAARFTLKIAYDELYSRYSPGVLLELENLRRMHGDRSTEWADSCAVPDHFMINRLFLDRRVIESLTIATGTMRGGLIASLLPLLRWSHRQFNRRRPFARRT